MKTDGSWDLGKARGLGPVTLQRHDEPGRHRNAREKSSDVRTYDVGGGEDKDLCMIHGRSGNRAAPRFFRLCLSPVQHPLPGRAFFSVLRLSFTCSPQPPWPVSVSVCVRLCEGRGRRREKVARMAQSYTSFDGEKGRVGKAYV